jgi:hypothetical protein
MVSFISSIKRTTTNTTTRRSIHSSDGCRRLLFCQCGRPRLFLAAALLGAGVILVALLADSNTPYTPLLLTFDTQQQSGDHSDGDSAPKAEAVDPTSSCLAEYRRVTEGRIGGLTREDLDRSRAYVGNRQRLGYLAEKLTQRTLPVTAVACGGSISVGHGVYPETARYADILEDWFNDKYSLPQDAPRKHQVHKMVSHGADVR